ncbi:DNA-binding transcriptional regulator, HxlR family [Nonomuraea solani]|uniref:DNA-binding transcriptional regulator, HxlR family n=1 Tax=Nonomuraea solani TaxID=1144553 RepID=A0A1H6EQ62_9ACTN|nr:helix-turn-helix domain-containing protein [Nonomuraea solani]SEG99962.1 DNA-binding transcriptional regulator, HxlR family [Nonomuraea solani]
MASRPYGHYCAVAKTLDLIGERWSLLVVRELLDGPKRYVDLLGGLVGISTDMLAARLKALEEAEIVTRRTLPAPAASKVYELTPLGRDLQPAVTELARFGIRLLGDQGDDDAFQIHWITPSLRAMFQPERARDLSVTVELRVGADAMHARVAGGALHTYPGPADAPDAVLTFTDAATLAEIGRDPAASLTAVSTGRLHVQGTPEAVQATRELFGLTR